jgi:serine/threonine protein kinase
MPPPTTFVTISFGKHDPPVVCGSLQPLYPGRDVGARLEESNRKKKGGEERLPLALKARWCANMSAAIAHVHRVAHTYHMDIKPGNFIVDGDDNLILCDWEQSDAPATTLAPEADGTWDVAVVAGDGDEGQAGKGMTGDKKAVSRPRLVYTKYEGPPRRNTEEEVGDTSWHQWNVFPLWSADCPLALELAEVFSLGRSMWMLLRQPSMDFDEIEHPNDLVTDWDGAEDIPESWKRMVDRCMAGDPNERPDVMEVLHFWEKAWADHGDYNG